MGQGEHDVPVTDVEEVGALALDPSGLRERLTLGAVAIAARGVLNRHRSAVVAGRLEPTERGGAAAHQRIDDALVLCREPMCPPVGGGALAQDVGDLQRRPGVRRQVVGMGHGSGPSATWELQQVQWGRGRGGLVLGQVQVAHGRADGVVPKPALDDGQRDPGLEQLAGIAMAKGMNPAGLADAGTVLGALVDARGRLTAHRAVQRSGGKQPALRPVTAPVLAQMRQQPRRERDVAVLAPLALLDTQTHPGGVDIGDLQSTELAGTQPRRVGGHQHCTMAQVGGDGEQAHQLLVNEQLGQPWRLAWRRARRSAGRAAQA